MDTEGTEIARRTISGAATAALGVALAPAFSANPDIAAYVAALTPAVLSPALEQSLSAVGSAVAWLTQRNAETIVNIAARESERDRDGLVEEVLSDPAQLGLFVQAVRASQATNSADKLLILGRTLSRAIDDPAVVDDESVFLARVERIEQYHVRFMRALERERDEVKDLISRIGPPGNRAVDAFTERQIAGRDRGLSHSFVALAHDLVTLGMVVKVNVDPHPRPGAVVVWDDHDVKDTPMAFRDVDQSVPMWALTQTGANLLARARMATRDESLGQRSD